MDLDLLALTAPLVTIPSVSHAEAALTDHLEAELRALPHLEVERVGANLVARTQLGRPLRVVLAGHTDTVPVNGNAERSHRRRRALGARRHRHEGRPGGDAGLAARRDRPRPWT